ncbi:MAG: P-type conjugative transfer ATPase TrbB [gamma proteobacterium symbiont of Lucinoma myriamae]|nr:P-type conjugative transfer ATPase TrbB [gamma proteobacterium symbiont of Lucinoma myriamae]
MTTSSDTTVKERAKTKLIRDMGPLLVDALNDPNTIELMLNADGKLWQECIDKPMTHIGDITTIRADSILKTLAGYHGKEITREKSLLECEVPLDGSRFAGQIPPVVTAPIFTIRKKAIRIFTLEDYLDDKVMTEEQYDVIKKSIKNHRNILIVGGTGTGKTTLVNACINEMVIINPTERLCIIEDTGEIQCTAINHIQYHTSIDVSMTQLLKTTLRMRPDRILVGEVRGPEALDLLMAWNTGHEGGAATIHANTAHSGLERLSTLISMNTHAPRQIESLIVEAVHVLISIVKTSEGRKIQDIIEVLGFENGKYLTKNLLKEKE